MLLIDRVNKLNQIGIAIGYKNDLNLFYLVVIPIGKIRFHKTLLLNRKVFTKKYFIID